MGVVKLLVLEGDGIGPEVVEQGLEVLKTVANHSDVCFEMEHASFGGCAIDAHGVPVTQEVLDLAKQADAVFLGAVGGPRWDDVAPEKRPERGLLQLRSELQVFANFRPARFFESLAHASPLRPELTAGVDFLTVRELVGGIYFGQPRGVTTESGQRTGTNTMRYNEDEIRRVGRMGFEAAQRRNRHLTSVDKANVLEVQRLWREVITDLANEYPDVTVEHMYVDNCAMQMVTRPGQFDVIVTGNMFGDILSDASAALTGSLGMLPSASVGEGTGLYEPVHGSAPDIAGQGKANPLGTILSAAMLLEHTVGNAKLAAAVTRAVERSLAQGLRTADISSNVGASGERLVGTTDMGAAVLGYLTEELKAL